jgi:hypothetical protein
MVRNRKIGSSANPVVWLGVLVVAICEALASDNNASSTSTPLVMRITVITNTANQCALSVTLSNANAFSVRLHERYTQWNSGTDGLRLVAIKSTQLDEPLREIGPMSHFASEVTIKSAERVTGTVNLYSRFPGLRSALEEDDVVVFWHSRLPKVDERPGHFSDQGGWVLLKKHTREYRDATH